MRAILLLPRPLDALAALLLAMLCLLLWPVGWLIEDVVGPAGRGSGGEDLGFSPG